MAVELLCQWDIKPVLLVPSGLGRKENKRFRGDPPDGDPRQVQEFGGKGGKEKTWLYREGWGR